MRPQAGQPSAPAGWRTCRHSHSTSTAPMMAGDQRADRSRSTGSLTHLRQLAADEGPGDADEDVGEDAVVGRS